MGLAVVDMGRYIGIGLEEVVSRSSLDRSEDLRVLHRNAPVPDSLEVVHRGLSVLPVSSCVQNKLVYKSLAYEGHRATSGRE